MARFETTREIMAQFDACNHLCATDPTIRNVLLKEGELSIGEAEQLYSYVDMYCNAWATTQMAFEQGLVDETIYASTVKDVEVAMNRWPSMRKPAARWISNYPEFADSEIFKAVDQYVRGYTEPAIQ
jgi:hypothetical protein